MARKRSRRAYLGAVAAGGLVGLAGCSGDSSPGTGSDDSSPGTGSDDSSPGEQSGGNGDGGQSPGDGSDPFPSLSPDDPAYRAWQPAEGELRGAVQAAHNVDRYRQHRDALPAATYESGTGWAMFGGYVGIEFGELDGVLTGIPLPGVVSVGSFARADVESRLESIPYERQTSRGGVTYYRWDGAAVSRFVGVGEAGVVHGPGGADTDSASQFADEVAVLFETARGDAPRLHETDSAYERYTDAVGWPLSAWAGPPRPGRQRGPGAGSAVTAAVSGDVAESLRWGRAKYLADGSLLDRYWLVPAPDGSVDAAGITEAYRAESARSELAPEGGSVLVRRERDVVEVGVVEPVSDPGGGTQPVLVALEATLEGKTATIRHAGGDPLPLGRATVRADGDRVDVGEGTLSPGGTRAVEVPDGTETVRVLYTAPNSESTVVLARS